MDIITEIEKAHRNLTDSSKELKAAFDQSSEKIVLTGGNEIPNPIQLLNRLSALESSLSTLKEDVHDLVLLRPLIASEATNSLLRNYNAIKELSLLVKGKQNENIHQVTETLVLKTQQQNQLWENEFTNESNEDDNDDDDKRSQMMMDAKKKLLSKREDDEDDNNDDHGGIDKENVATIQNNIKCQSINAISEQDFHDCVPESIRGRCKLDSIKNVASFIEIEVGNRIASGLNGTDLYIERQHLTKYCGIKPGLLGVIKDNSLWRDVVSTLNYLDFVEIEKDGLIRLRERH